jgi:hypothetical protein
MKRILLALAALALFACASRYGEEPIKVIELQEEAPIEPVEPGEPIIEPGE